MGTYRIKVVFIGRRDMDCGWPHHRFDIEKESKRLKDELSSIEERIDGIEFFGWDVVTTDEEKERAISELDEADGILVLPLTFGFGDMWEPAKVGELAEIGKPLLVYTRPFSVYHNLSAQLRDYKGALSVQSSKIEDIIPKLEVMRSVSKLKDMIVLVVRDPADPNYAMAEMRYMGPFYKKMVQETFGIKIVEASSEELISSYNSIGVEEATKVANKIIRSASGLKEPLKEEVISASRMYLAMKHLMEEKGANAITVDCLTMINQKILPISPCIGVSKLNDEGIPAACEADIETMITMCICHALAGKPGFQNDPLLDESENTLVLAHCTAPTKMQGYSGESSPYFIRNHTECWRGVALEVKMKVGQEVTLLTIMGRASEAKIGWPQVLAGKPFGGYKFALLAASNLRITDNISSEWGCRTKVAISLDDDQAKEWKDNFYGHHRTMLYGNWIEKLEILSRLLGIEFINKLTCPTDWKRKP